MWVLSPGFVTFEEEAYGEIKYTKYKWSLTDNMEQPNPGRNNPWGFQSLGLTLVTNPNTPGQSIYW